MNAGEVGEGGGCEHRVAFSRGCWHQGKNDPCRGKRGGNGQGDKNLAMTPMEVMTQAQAMRFASPQTEVGVKEPVCDVSCPGRQSQKNGNPHRQTNICRPGESQRPHHGDGGGIEAGKMPKAQRSRRVPRLLLSIFTDS